MASDGRCFHSGGTSLLSTGLPGTSGGYAYSTWGRDQTSPLYQRPYIIETMHSYQGFPKDKIIAGCSVFIAGHMAISGLIFSIF